MVKSLEESAEERRNYVKQARAAFHNQGQEQSSEPVQEEAAVGNSTLGMRFVIAVLLFVCFVYCDQENVMFQGIGAKEVVQQIEWKPFPTEKLEALLSDIDISKIKDEKNNQ